MILTLMDADARRRSEEELRRVRNYLDLVVENLPVPRVRPRGRDGTLREPQPGGRDDHGPHPQAGRAAAPGRRSMRGRSPTCTPNSTARRRSTGTQVRAPARRDAAAPTASG
ncbi:MAG: hypothetical protein MZV64_48610 [Ignavibacteriales bacterium]|nr:hypothetical protein [Ignavibacteriales bacterium]